MAASGTHNTPSRLLPPDLSSQVLLGWNEGVELTTGAVGSNRCPGGTVALTENECTSLGRESGYGGWIGTIPYNDQPKGCFIIHAPNPNNSGRYFGNPGDGVGTANASGGLICKPSSLDTIISLNRLELLALMQKEIRSTPRCGRATTNFMPPDVRAWLLQMMVDVLNSDQSDIVYETRDPALRNIFGTIDQCVSRDANTLQN